MFYPYNRGALFTALVVIYALTSGIAGYTATSFYCQLEGTNWVWADFLAFERTTKQQKILQKIRENLTIHVFDLFVIFPSTGKEPLINGLPVLWAFVSDLLLPEHGSNCV